MDISLVIPAYNESGSIKQLLDASVKALESTGMSYEIIVINDGSNDDTFEQLIKLLNNLSQLRVLDLSRNFGKEAALTAGIDASTGRGVIPMDADLQHPPELIPLLIERWQQGFDVVLCRRASRKSDHWFQRHISSMFYRVHNAVSELVIPQDVGDFRLLDRKVVEALKLLPERRRFMKGIFAWVGFRTSILEFDTNVRFSGKSHFSGWRLWNFALEGITSFSTVPLRIWTYIGGVISLGAIGYATKVILSTIIYRTDLPGYPSLFCAILFLGGVQLIGIGVLGEYIGRIYQQIRNRPRYVVQTVLEKK